MNPKQSKENAEDGGAVLPFAAFCKKSGDAAMGSELQDCISEF